ncbi:MAG: hypothetical protein CME70_16470 [Halobacteriovorax sp.]|nr:hypothetical protein [Halobacteriovorax sp.]|tara:strand:+ start:38605 stop:40128 length:1524 start_codon:yes stop_codon:yes gene_type:complete
MKAQDFLAIADKFHLGSLPTEQPHPKTKQLSTLAKSDCLKAVTLLHQIDLEMLSVLRTKLLEIKKLSKELKEVFSKGGRVFLCGCGATGRLSLVLETIWRHDHPNDNRVQSFMAGGDVALISSIEKFEDYPDYGKRQLEEMGFKEGDILLASSEGGETPWVIGAAERATELSSYGSYFLYCNPDEILIKQVERSKKIIENPKVKKINLSTGPMALSGSTRMQASSILMYAIGLALNGTEKGSEWIEESFEGFNKFFSELDFTPFADFVIHEADHYKKGDYIFYQSSAFLGISILTDTTERSPTFSLFPFENKNDEEKAKRASLVYLKLMGATSAEEAWRKLLYREPRTFKWEDSEGFGDRTTHEKLLGFDISENIVMERESYLKGKSTTFIIEQLGVDLHFKIDDLNWSTGISHLNSLEIHMLLKMILNNHSTLVMGRLGRYEGNLMTWVRTSNNKLIDRAIRYVEILLKEKGIKKSYEEIATALFELKSELSEDEPLVMKLVEELS